MKLDPIVSQFETSKQADNYVRWLTEKVERVLSSGQKTVPHEDVAARAAQRRAELLAELNNAR